MIASYDKIHMFDIDLPGGESYRESANYQPGETAVIADLPWGRIGLTICYDVRFPALYRALAEAGVEALPGDFLDFRDPWGNRIEIVAYADIQFSKTEGVLRGMGLNRLTKSAEAVKELAEKGMGAG